MDSVLAICDCDVCWWMVVLPNDFVYGAELLVALFASGGIDSKRRCDAMCWLTTDLGISGHSE